MPIPATNRFNKLVNNFARRCTVSLFTVGLIIVLAMAGCSTAGHLQSRDFEVLSSTGATPTVAIKLDPNLSYWWGPWEPDLKDRVAGEIRRYLMSKRVRVVEDSPDITIVIKKIDTGGWTGGIVITHIELVGLKDSQELFAIVYDQHGDAFTPRGFLRPSKNEYKVARLLAGEVIKRLRASRASIVSTK